MPTLPRDLFLEGVTQVIKLDQAWLPESRPDIARYLRPFVIATEVRRELWRRFLPDAKSNRSWFRPVDLETHQLLEEAGTMNVMMYANGTLITQPISSSILDGNTRDS